MDCFEMANGFFEDENIKCDSEVDQNTVGMVYEALQVNNLDTCNDDNLTDALSSLDSNVYNLCQAIMYQNFMLMRKVDSLTETVSDLRRRLCSM